MKKKEKCLDILSTSDGDDESEIEEINDKKSYTIKKSNDKDDNIINNIQNSYVRSANNILYKMIKSKKINFVKSTKNIKSTNRVNNTDKKIFFNFKKMDYQLNLFATKKRADSLKNNETSNTTKTNLINIFIKSQNNNAKEILKRNTFKSINYENNKEFNYKSLRIMNSTQKSKFVKKYELKHYNKKQLPDLNSINSQIRQKHISSKQYSLNESENYNLVSLVLPNIKSLQKADNLRKNIKKIIIGNRHYKIKNS